jgi:hypothetical protein
MVFASCKVVYTENNSARLSIDALLMTSQSRLVTRDISRSCYLYRFARAAATQVVILMLFVADRPRGRATNGLRTYSTSSRTTFSISITSLTSDLPVSDAHFHVHVVVVVKYPRNYPPQLVS